MGLLADAPLAEVIERSLACNDAARELGWSGATPFLTLAFLALSVIPSLKITDRGLVDVDRFELVRWRLPRRPMSILYAGGWIVTCDDEGTEHPAGWLLVEDGVVQAVGDGDEPTAASGRPRRRGRHPGLVNTHHHFYQTLTRPGAGSRSLHVAPRAYPVWAGVDAEAEYTAARTALAELALSGCTTAFDHHYVFPEAARA